MLVFILLVGCLSGCSNESEPAVTQQDSANFLPDATVLTTAAPTNTPAPTEAPLASVADATATPSPELLFGLDEPDSEATATPEPIAMPTAASPYADYNYTALTDTSFGFVLTYPTTWRNLPGKYTICFEEQVSEGDFPARVAVTSKKMPHKPDAETAAEQFQAYAHTIYKQYDPKTFEFGELTPTTFMGKNAYEIGYLAYSDDIEVQGYMCCCAIDYTIYVFHFCSSYNDYEDMQPVRIRIRDSVSLVG